MPSRFGSNKAFTVDAWGLRQSDAGARWQSFLVVLNDTLRSVADPTEIEGQACTLLCQALKVDRVSYLEINEAEGRITIARDALRNGATTTAGEYRLSDFAWAVEVFRRGQCLVVEDTQNSSLVPEQSRRAVAAISVVGCIGAPVQKGGVLIGALCANVAYPRGWSSEELWLLEDVAERIWATLLQARTAQALQAKTIELEHQAEQLRRLATDLTLAEHNTRQLLSKTLHDGLQQFLVATKFALDSAVQQAGPHEPLERARSNLLEAIEAARSLSVDLFPPVLHNNGLPEALEWLASWMHKKYGKEVTVQAHAEADPGGREARILVFESVRELIFNSVKHANTPAIFVTASVTPDNEVCVEVSDDGDGFASKNVFNAASTGHSLGLVAIRERLKILGGSMFLDSSPGDGCRVRIQIPRSLCTEEDVAAPLSEMPPALAASPIVWDRDTAQRPLRVLIVDDHQVFREGLIALLKGRSELKVVGEAGDGADAIRKVVELEPDAVVMDVSMPNLDGVQATAAITKRFPKIKVFGLSMVQVTPGRIHPIQRAGASGVFSKDAGAQFLVDALIKEYPPIDHP